MADQLNGAFVTTGDGNVWEFHPAAEQFGFTEKIWEKEIPDEPNEVVVSSLGVVYAGTQYKSVYAVDHEGNFIFDYFLPDAVKTLALVDDLTIVAGTVAGEIYEIHNDDTYTTDSETNTWKWNVTEKWHISAGAEVNDVAVGESGLIYAGTNDNKILQLATDGTINWSKELGSPVTAVAVDETGVYAGTLNNNLYKLSGSGEIVWQTNVVNSVAIISIFNNSIYVGTKSGNLLNVDLTGKIVWNTKVNGEITGIFPPTSGNVNITVSDINGFINRVYTDGTLTYCIGTSNHINTLGCNPQFNSVQGHDYYFAGTNLYSVTQYANL